MVTAAYKTGIAVSGIVFAGVTHIATIVTAAVVIGGVFTLGVLRSVAWAWREEKDAAIAKADRLEEEVEVARRERGELKARVDVLEKQTNFADYQQKVSAEHRAIVGALEALRAVLGEHTKILTALKLGIPNCLEEGEKP